MACKQLYSHGQQDKKHTECSSSNTGDRLAAPGFWII